MSAITQFQKSKTAWQLGHAPKSETVCDQIILPHSLHCLVDKPSLGKTVSLLHQIHCYSTKMTEAGMSHERFCTLCGLTFDEYTELWDASLNMADIIWVSYYRVRKWLKAEQPRVTIMLSVLQSGHGMARSET